MPRGPLRDLGREAHYSLGVLALGLAVLRLAWRAVRPLPGPLPGTPRWQHGAARLMHGALLLTALAVPAAGLLDRWARGRPVSVFGGLPLPPPFPIPGGRLWGEAHEALAWSLAALLAVHLLAVAWHVLVLHDGTFRRMLGQSCRLG
ncbi:cytochrome b [Siccirubricoccus sp. G192]|uniref:cytochrome b n=1 Tax=Siccirubricoccus sp. G192 TaxID=2849651 RepID=UPI001C2BC0F2|nr:cytochrome b/b6 domain-containing protein [Siccirubricoccus sp. G192]MBV1799927.1 cytochrome b/b6 domain-containing protein [Siccirubricoccus sp. G192]